MFYIPTWLKSKAWSNQPGLVVSWYGCFVVWMFCCGTLRRGDTSITRINQHNNQTNKPPMPGLRIFFNFHKLAHRLSQNSAWLHIPHWTGGSIHEYDPNIQYKLINKNYSKWSYAHGHGGRCCGTYALYICVYSPPYANISI